MSEWQPINTAPKDKQIDLWNGYRRVVNCVWSVHFEKWMHPAGHSDGYIYHVEVENPTH